MAGLARKYRGTRPPLDIGSVLRKQGNFPAKGRKNNDFAVLDLALARIVNGGDCQPFPAFWHGGMGP
jgi:hypothetical protein